MSNPVSNPIVSFTIEAFSQFTETRIVRTAETKEKAEELFKEIRKNARSLLRIRNSTTFKMELRKCREGYKKSVVLRSVIAA